MPGAHEIPPERIITLLLDLMERQVEVAGKVDNLLTAGQDASLARERIYDKVEAVGRHVSAVEIAAAATAVTVARITPIVDNLEKKHQRAIGIAWFLGLLPGLVIAAWQSLRNH